ncbi:MAG: hypothetical protein ABJA61_03300 [Caldimonas sp.]
MLEALIAFIVLAAGTVAASHLQTTFRLDADLARERSEAVRLGEAEMESLRAYSVLAAASGANSYESVRDAASVIDGASGYASNTSYRIVRRIDDAAVSGAKSASVKVQWTDRGGTGREVALASFIAHIDPAYAGTLSLGASAIPSVTRGALGRAPPVPVEARNLGGGRSVWKPVAAGSVAVIFDTASGDIVRRSDGIAATTVTRDLSTADLAACASGRRLLVGGAIRFTAATPPNATQANDAPPAVTVALNLTGGTYPEAPLCTAEPKKTVRYVAGGSVHVEAVTVDATPASAGVASWDDTGDRFVAWQCIVSPRADGRWSGRATLVGSGWTIGTGSADRRVCRYAADLDGSGAIDANIEHPADYANVNAALVAQNFLVVRGSEICPGAPAVRLTGEGSTVYADLGTVQHQP